MEENNRSEAVLASASLDEQVYEIEKTLRNINKVIRRKLRENLSAFSLTPPQFEALVHLSHSDNLPIGQLSTKLGMSFSSTTDLVDRMERHGLVSRERDEHDRRKVLLTATEKGQQLMNRVLAIHHEHLAATFADVETEDLRAYVASLRDLYERVTKQPKS